MKSVSCSKGFRRAIGDEEEYGQPLEEELLDEGPGYSKWECEAPVVVERSASMSKLEAGAGAGAAL